MNMYIKRSVANKDALAHTRREVHVVDNLKIKLQLGMDLMVSERMTTDLVSKKLGFRSCKGLETTIEVTAKDSTRVR